jgi:hypothetical protein
LATVLSEVAEEAVAQEVTPSSSSEGGRSLDPAVSPESFTPQPFAVASHTALARLAALDSVQEEGAQVARTPNSHTIVFQLLVPAREKEEKVIMAAEAAVGGVARMDQERPAETEALAGAAARELLRMATIATVVEVANLAAVAVRASNSLEPVANLAATPSVRMVVAVEPSAVPSSVMREM